MSDTVGVRFRRAGRIYYFEASEVEDLAVGDWVIVETSRGLDAGRVVIAPSQVLSSAAQDLKPIRRRATWQDLTELARLRTQEDAALMRAREHIAQHGLPMKPVRAEYNYDGSQLTIHFVTSAQRVDFRDLVRDLARAFRTRVHLRQVGPRDWSKLVGGVDRCGMELCCATWMAEFVPISIRMAKRQNLPLNPSEISGMCGKLLCCLAFEDEHYKTVQGGLPRVGSKVTTASGTGKVVDVNVLTRRLTIGWDTGARLTVDADEFAAEQGLRDEARQAETDHHDGESGDRASEAGRDGDEAD